MSQGRYRLRTFGVLRLEQDGQVIGRFLPTRTSDRVLAIVMAGGGTAPISEVIEQVWGSVIHRDPRLLLNEITCISCAGAWRSGGSRHRSPRSPVRSAI